MGLDMGGRFGYRPRFLDMEPGLDTDPGLDMEPALGTDPGLDRVSVLPRVKTLMPQESFRRP
jgi:hypothetical protein